MTATATQIAEIRRLVNEPTDSVYTDNLIKAIIENYPKIDELGTDPYYYVYVDGVQTKTTTTGWIPTYDIYAAASQIWYEKAATFAGSFDFNADGGDYTQSQEYTHAKSMGDNFMARSSIKTIHQFVAIDEAPANLSWIGNLPEQD